MRTPFFVDVGDRFDRRARRHHVGRLDLDIGRREGHHGRALRLAAPIKPMSHTFLARLVGELAWRLEGT